MYSCSSFFSNPAAVLMSIDTSTIGSQVKKGEHIILVEFKETMVLLNGFIDKYLEHESDYYKRFTESFVPTSELKSIIQITPTILKQGEKLIDLLGDLSSKISEVNTFISNIKKIQNRFKEYYDLANLYLEVQHAGQEIKNGDTITMDELFGGD